MRELPEELRQKLSGMAWIQGVAPDDLLEGIVREALEKGDGLARDGMTESRRTEKMMDELFGDIAIMAELLKTLAGRIDRRSDDIDGRLVAIEALLSGSGGASRSRDEKGAVLMEKALVSSMIGKLDIGSRLRKGASAEDGRGQRD